MSWPVSIEEAEVKAWAALSNVPIDPAHLAGAAAAMAMLGRQAALLSAPPLAAETEPAAVFRA